MDDIVSHVRALTSLVSHVILVYDGDGMPGKAETRGPRSVDLDALFQSVQTTLEEEKYIVSNSTTNGKGIFGEGEEDSGNYLHTTHHRFGLTRGLQISAHPYIQNLNKCSTS